MSLFSAVPGDARRGSPSPQMRFGWALLVFALVATIVLSFVPSPYVVQQPGPVFDTLGTVGEGENAEDLIALDAKTYETSGRLDLLTVSVVGSRNTPVGWFSVLRAWFDPSRSALPIDAVYPPGYDIEQSEQDNRILMENSQAEAVAAALTALGYDIVGTVRVATVVEGMPADGVLEVGDEILTAGGVTPRDVSELREILSDHGADDPIRVVVRRDGRTVEVQATPTRDEASGSVILGVTAGVEYDFPVDVDITLDRVGGPSAGMMFALGIVDKLTPGAATGGEHIAGTGTISGTGVVGAIGGVRQKMYGAADAGAEWMLIPEDNCGDLAGPAPRGLSVIPVATLDEAIGAVEAIGDGEGASLETCS